MLLLPGDLIISVTTIYIFSGNIEFRNVYFSYPTRPDHQVLSNFSLIIRKGTMVALCGPSGGKHVDVRIGAWISSKF